MSQAERLYPWQYLQLLHQSQSKGQYLCEGYITLYTIIPSLMSSVTVSSLPVEYLCLHRQSQPKGQYLCKGYITPYTIIPFLDQSSASVKELKQGDKLYYLQAWYLGKLCGQLQSIYKMTYFVREIATGVFKVFPLLYVLLG